MAVIAQSRLLRQRRRKLERRRDALLTQRAASRMAAPLPEWAAQVLCRLGMTRAEIDRFDADSVGRLADGAATDIDAGLAALDRELAMVEDQILAASADDPERLQVLADVAVQRLRRAADDATARGPDVGALAVMERLVAELRGMGLDPVRRAV